MNRDELAQHLAFAEGLAQEAGEVMRQYFRSDKLATSWKEKNSPVTVADSKINQLVIDRVKIEYPSHGILGEEDSFRPEAETVWVVDPIDGTNMFNLGMPNSTFCLSLVVNGVVQVAVVLDPFLKRLITATKGDGAYINKTKVIIEPTTKFEHAYIFAQADATDNSDTTSKIYKILKQLGVKVITIPSFTYMAAAILEGKMIAAFMPYGSPWDAAAISLIIQEAGGKATDLHGGERRYNEWGEGILVSNGAVHERLVEMVRNANIGD